MNDKFDQADQHSIESYAKKLQGSSLRNYVDTNFVREPGNKGAFGTILEEYYFGIKPNSRPEPDFLEAGLEIKSSPLKKLRNDTWVAKERLVMSKISYNDVVKETFEKSSFLSKNQLLLLIFYLYEKGVDVLDYIIRLAKIWNFPEEDLKIIKNDWDTIVDKIKAGKAHELSEGDTLYLGACTKSSNSDVRVSQPFSSELAKPRAFSLKQSYLNGIIQNFLTEETESVVKRIDEYDKDTTFENIVKNKFEPFIGMTSEQISKKLELDINKTSKHYFATLARRIMGIKKKKILEFEKAGVEMKVIQIKKSGIPKEDMSFPKFNYMELAKEKWEDKDNGGDTIECEFKQQLQKRFFFVVFECARVCEKEEDRVLKKVMFWTIPVKDIEGEVKRVWEETVKRINSGHADELPKKSESSVAHVRPHARNAEDTEETPRNGQLVKKCFWLNKEYIKEQIK